MQASYVLTAKTESCSIVIVYKPIKLVHICNPVLARLAWLTQVLGSSSGQDWSLLLSFISLGAGTAEQVISQ